MITIAKVLTLPWSWSDCLFWVHFILGLWLVRVAGFKVVRSIGQIFSARFGFSGGFRGFVDVMLYVLVSARFGFCGFILIRLVDWWWLLVG